MTEQEAMIRFDFIRCALLAGTKPEIIPNEDNVELMDVAIKALEEIKKYRQIGTLEECRNSVLETQKAYNKESKLELGQHVFVIYPFSKDPIREKVVVEIRQMLSYNGTKEIYFRTGKKIPISQGLFMISEETFHRFNDIGRHVFLRKDSAEVALKYFEDDHMKIFHQRVDLILNDDL